MADTPLRLSFNPFEVEEFATSLPIFSTVLTGDVVGSWVHWLLVVAYILMIGYLINIYFGQDEEAQFFRAMEKQGQLKGIEKRDVDVWNANASSLFRDNGNRSYQCSLGGFHDYRPCWIV